MHSDRIRRIVPSLDGGKDVLVLTDSPTVSVYHREEAPSHSHSSKPTEASIPIYKLRKEPRPVLPNAPIDAVWCPYKRSSSSSLSSLSSLSSPQRGGEENCSYLCTAWGSAVRLIDVDDGAVRATYYAANTMDEVAFAQSLLWLRAPTRQEQFVAGYGRSLECCVALFDVMSEGKSPVFTYEPTKAKCCNYSADAASSAVVVSALAEVRNNLVAFGTMRGSVELVDLRSRCCAGAIGGWTASGAGFAVRGPAAAASFVRHSAGIVQILSLDGPSLGLSTPSLVEGGIPAEKADAAAKKGPQPSTAYSTAPDDHRFITVPRRGDGRVLAWDMRCLANPIAVIERGDAATNALRNVGVLGGSLIVPYGDRAPHAGGLASVPLADVFCSGPSTRSDSHDASAVRRLKASDYAMVDARSSSPPPPVLEVPLLSAPAPVGASASSLPPAYADDDDADGKALRDHPVPQTTAEAMRPYRTDDAPCGGPIAIAGGVIIVAGTSTPSSGLCTSMDDVKKALAQKSQHRCAAVASCGAGPKRTREGGVCGYDSDDGADYVVLRSRRAMASAKTTTVVLSDTEDS